MENFTRFTSTRRYKFEKPCPLVEPHLYYPRASILCKTLVLSLLNGNFPVLTLRYRYKSVQAGVELIARTT